MYSIESNFTNTDTDSNGPPNTLKRVDVIKKPNFDTFKVEYEMISDRSEK